MLRSSTVKDNAVLIEVNDSAFHTVDDGSASLLDLREDFNEFHSLEGKLLDGLRSSVHIIKQTDWKPVELLLLQ